MKKRIETEAGFELSTICRQATDCKMRETDMANTLSLTSIE
jgi:hypothetical protein